MITAQKGSGQLTSTRSLLSLGVATGAGGLHGVGDRERVLVVVVVEVFEARDELVLRTSHPKACRRDANTVHMVDAEAELYHAHHYSPCRYFCSIVYTVYCSTLFGSPRKKYSMSAGLSDRFFATPPE